MNGYNTKLVHRVTATERNLEDRRVQSEVD